MRSEPLLARLLRGKGIQELTILGDSGACHIWSFRGLSVRMWDSVPQCRFGTTNTVQRVGVASGAVRRCRAGAANNERNEQSALSFLILLTASLHTSQLTHCNRIEITRLHLQDTVHTTLNTVYTEKFNGTHRSSREPPCPYRAPSVRLRACFPDPARVPLCSSVFSIFVFCYIESGTYLLMY